MYVYGSLHLQLLKMTSSSRFLSNGQHLPETDQPTLLSAATLQIFLQNITCNSPEVVQRVNFYCVSVQVEGDLSE